MSKHYLLLFICLFFAFAVRAEEINEKVDVDLGANLVKSAMVGTRYQGSSFGVPNEYNRQTFLIYQILGKYEGTVAWLAVNPWTGDVWNMDECQLFSNAALLKAQAEIKRRFSKEELKEYDRLHQLKPYRMYDLEPCESSKD